MSTALYRFVFFFKQKTAYEMRISDWSSDVCSSDLTNTRPAICRAPSLHCCTVAAIRRSPDVARSRPPPPSRADRAARDRTGPGDGRADADEIGSASCRERGCQYV